ncbi:unnamed protein product, partial [Nesidiocoris tenuis]
MQRPGRLPRKITKVRDTSSNWPADRDCFVLYQNIFYGKRLQSGKNALYLVLRSNVLLKEELFHLGRVKQCDRIKQRRTSPPISESGQFVAVEQKLHEINLLKFVGPMSRLQFIISDYSSKGSPYVYVTDAGTKKLIVWDVDANEGTAVPLPENCGTEFTPRDVLYAVL